MGGRIASLWAEIGADISGLKRGLKEARANLGQTKNTMKDFGIASAKVFGGVAAAAFAAKKAIDFTREGAEIEYIIGKFNRLANTIGTTGDALERDLKRATKNTISQAKLLAGASDLMGLGLAKSHDEAVRLATVVAGLNMDINELVLTLTNQTTRRFDQLNVSVDGFKDRLEALKQQGLDTDAAFKEAFLQQAEEQLRKVGNAADTSLGDLNRLTSGIEDMLNSIKKGMPTAFGPAIKSLGSLVVFLNEGRAAADKGVITQHQLNMAVLGLVSPSQDAEKALEELRKQVDEYKVSAKKAAEASFALARGAFAAAGVEIPESTLRDQLMQQIEQSRTAGEETAQAFNEGFKAKMEALDLAVQDPLGNLKDQFKQSEDDLVEQAARLRDAITDIEGHPLTERGRAELLELQREFGNTKTAIMDNAAAYEYETKVALFGMLQQRLAQMELTDAQQSAAFTMLNNIARGWGIIGEDTFQALNAIDAALGQFAQGNVKQAQEEILNIGRAALSVEGDYYINFHVSLDATGSGDILDKDLKKIAQGAGNIDDLINNKFPKGTFSGLKGTGGLTKAAKEAKKRDPVREALDLAGALAGIGSTAASILQEQTIDPLKEQLAALDELLSPGHADLIVREQSAELEEKRAKAAQELAEAEKKVLEFQKAQQKLRFLEQQVRLLDLIKENKLNLKDILGDTKLGLDADMGEVLAAMTKAIEELIKKTEDKLKLGSPSKVFTDMFREIPAGAKLGLERGTNDLANAMDNMLGMVLPSGSIVGPAINENGQGTQQSGQVVINVYPSAGMDEEELARKVGEVYKRRIR